MLKTCFCGPQGHQQNKASPPHLPAYRPRSRVRSPCFHGLCEVSSAKSPRYPDAHGMNVQEAVYFHFTKSIEKQRAPSPEQRLAKTTQPSMKPNRMVRYNHPRVLRTRMRKSSNSSHGSETKRGLQRTNASMSRATMGQVINETTLSDQKKTPRGDPPPENVETG